MSRSVQVLKVAQLLCGSEITALPLLSTQYFNLRIAVPMDDARSIAAAAKHHRHPQYLADLIEAGADPAFDDLVSHHVGKTSARVPCK
jgi:hypothetical protein